MTSPEPLDRREPLPIAVEQRVDSDDVGIDVRHGEAFGPKSRGG